MVIHYIINTLLFTEIISEPYIINVSSSSLVCKKKRNMACTFLIKIIFWEISSVPKPSRQLKFSEVFKTLIS